MPAGSLRSICVHVCSHMYTQDYTYTGGMTCKYFVENFFFMSLCSNLIKIKATIFRTALYQPTPIPWRKITFKRQRQWLDVSSGWFTLLLLSLQICTFSIALCHLIDDFYLSHKLINIWQFEMRHKAVVHWNLLSLCVCLIY